MHMGVDIRECDSTLYVGLAPPPTNANFQIPFLLTRLQEALFEVYHHFSGLSFVAEVNFWRPLKTVVSCNLFIIIIIISFSSISTSSDGFSQSVLKRMLHHLYH